MKKLYNSIEEVIQELNIIHNFKYSYRGLKETLMAKKVKIICPIHGEFEQFLSSHFQGKGCKLCANTLNQEKRKKGKELFTIESQKQHNFKYDYSLVEYKNNSTKVKIICPIHGIFEQTPKEHVKSKIGCKKCFHEFYCSFSKEKWIARCNKNYKGLAIFYIIKCFNEDEEFYKIGITSKSVKQRYKGIKNMPYNYEIIHEYTDQAELIYDLEKFFHKHLKKFKYNPLISFGGSSQECFTTTTSQVARRRNTT